MYVASMSSGEPTYVALGLWLVAVLSHDLLEGDVETKDFGHDVDTAHDDLVQMTVSHQVWCLEHGILETRPYSVDTERERESERTGKLFITHLHIIAPYVHL